MGASISPQIGGRLRLRSRFFPGHPHLKVNYPSACMVDLPQGCPATVVATHGTDILVSIRSDPYTPAASTVEVWVPVHLTDYYFEGQA